MGLFDELKKISKGDIEKFGKDIVSGIQNATNDITKTVSNEIKNTTGINTEQSNSSSGKEVPSEYSEFPRFSKNPDDITTKETEKYTRCSMTFYSATAEEIQNYASQIESLGYTKNTKVRFDKGNTYIIVDDDPSNGDLNLVFHIKK
jgi:hypothetical protein